MIAYDLRCARGHLFEGWFDDSDAFLRQKDEGLLLCPVCENKDIERVPSVFAVKSGSTKKDAGRFQEAAIRNLYNQITDYVEKNFEDVGADFAKEALKMHYGVTSPKNIRGHSTKEEEKLLKEEGIDFFKLPVPRPDSDA